MTTAFAMLKETEGAGAQAADTSLCGLQDGEFREQRRRPAMTLHTDCYPCLMRQAQEAARMVTDDRRLHREVMSAVLETLERLPRDVTPAEAAQAVHRLIRKRTRSRDPYHRRKQAANAEALRLLPQLERWVQRSGDPLLAAVRLAIAGNAMDMGAVPACADPPAVSLRDLASSADLAGYPLFRRAVAAASKVLYLTDNAGEIVMDRLLVRELAHRTRADLTVMVRGFPVLNDATADDALEAGIDRFAAVVPNGSDAPTTVLHTSSPVVRKLFREADVIISKGQGNYEGLSREPLPLFHLLKVKCPVIASELGAPVGTPVLSPSGFWRARDADSDAARPVETAAAAPPPGRPPGEREALA